MIDDEDVVVNKDHRDMESTAVPAMDVELTAGNLDSLEDGEGDLDMGRPEAKRHEAKRAVVKKLERNKGGLF